MSFTSENAKTEETFIHTFGFAESDHIISLTEEQLQRIPYLDAFISNADKFFYHRNKDNAFVLGHPIQYASYNPILYAVLNEKSSYLFAKLPRHVDVFCMLQLYEYMCIEPLPIPSLKPIRIIYPDDTRLFSEEYHRASPSEARDTTVEFVIAIANRKYDLNNVETVKTIFDLLVDILSSVSVFGQRLRYHTLIIVEHCCFDIFTSDQRTLLRAYKRSLEVLTDLDEDPDDVSLCLEAPFNHMFYWRKQSRSAADKVKYRGFPIACFLRDIDLLYWHPRLPRFSYPLFMYEYPSWCKRCSCSDSYSPLLWSGYDLYWYRRPPLCKRCNEQERLIFFQDYMKGQLSCPCGYLHHWARMKYKESSTEDLLAIRDLNFNYSSKLKDLDFKVVTCLLKCCSKLQSAKNKRERQFMYSGRSHYSHSAPTVDKFKNKHNVKNQKHQ